MDRMESNWPPAPIASRVPHAQSGPMWTSHHAADSTYTNNRSAEYAEQDKPTVKHLIDTTITIHRTDVQYREK